jgi:hypothetical protein
VGKGWEVPIDRLLFTSLKAFADLVQTTSLARVHEKMGRISFPPATPSEV